jgi:hypothetical protein
MKVDELVKSQNSTAKLKASNTAQQAGKNFYGKII